MVCRSLLSDEPVTEVSLTDPAPGGIPNRHDRRYCRTRREPTRLGGPPLLLRPARTAHLRLISDGRIEGTAAMTSDATVRTNDSAADPEELDEWSESFDQLLAAGGQERAAAVLRRLGQQAADAGLDGYETVTTDYVNTIAVAEEPEFPGDEDIEKSYRRLIRWNAAVMVQRAQRPGIGVGGHISTYAGAATLYEVGLNHFFRGPDHPGGGDQVFFQGHASPGMYARAFLEGRLSEEDLDGFRQEKFQGAARSAVLPAPAADAASSGSSRRCRWGSGR